MERQSSYAARSRARGEDLRRRGEALILSVESSCDEPAVAVVRNGGYYEYKPQFVKLIPVIENPESEQVAEIESLAERAISGDKEAERLIDERLAMLYGISLEDIL